MQDPSACHMLGFVPGNFSEFSSNPCIDSGPTWRICRLCDAWSWSESSSAASLGKELTRRQRRLLVRCKIWSQKANLFSCHAVQPTSHGTLPETELFLSAGYFPVRPGLVPRKKYNPDGFSMDARNILHFVVSWPGPPG
jgi:hypothetical protein